MSTKQALETMKLKPTECAAAIQTMMPTNRAVFMWGPPGISKSDTLRQVCRTLGIGFIDVRLSQMDPTDLRGIPYPTVDNGVHGVRWSAPIVLPRDVDFDIVTPIEADETLIRFANPLNAPVEIKVHAIGKGLTANIVEKRVTRNDQFTDQNGIVHPDAFVVTITNEAGELVPGKVHWKATGKVRGILALEEFNSAPQSVQAAAYQLVLDRALGEYVVPDGVFIVALGNRDTDKGVTYKMPTPIMNRFVHIEMRCDFEDWQTWAVTHDVHPEVIGYLTAFKDCLFQFEAGTAARGFPTPRSWHFVSDILNTTKNGGYISDQVLRGLLTGAVGDAEGSKIMAFRKIAQDLPSAESILSGRLTKMPNKVEVQLAYALTTTLCYELKSKAEEVKRKHGDKHRDATAERKQWLVEADNFMAFMMANFSPEICIMGARMAIQLHRLPLEPQKMKHFDAFSEKFKKIIISSVSYIALGVSAALSCAGVLLA